MIAKKAPFQFTDIVLNQSSFKFQPFPANAKIPDDVERTVSNYVVDINFMFKEEDNEQEGSFLFAKVSVNMNDPSPGYVIFAECMGYIATKVYEGLNDRQHQNQVSIPAINSAINFLRGYIANITAYAPLGKYILPTIDLADLLKSKGEDLAKARSSNALRKAKGK